MNGSNDKIKGYLYILDVKDIALPVCKIGMTARNPFDRCSEINNSSTGDFIWEVAHYVAVDDCKKLESIFHKKLEPLRQKNREFFNINAEVAYKALLSILQNQSEIKRIVNKDINRSQEVVPRMEKKKSKSKQKFRNIDSKYTELLQLFTALIGVKGRPFGQLNKPKLGMSDGNEGVQWNIEILTDVEKIQLDVNLEGMKYTNWPIATFILSELENSSITTFRTKLKHPEYVFIQVKRDAWQVMSRPDIVENYLGGTVISMSQIDSELWMSILTEALGCLNEKKQYRGRNKQTVTLVNKPKNGDQTKHMEVSPHLTIWTPIEFSGDIKLNLKNGITLLEPVYEWVDRVSR